MASCDHTLGRANKPLQLFAFAIDEQRLLFFIYFVPISLTFSLAGWQSLTHIYLFSIPCILIGYHLLGGYFLSRCTVFQHSLSLIALFHLYHFTCCDASS